MNMTKRPQLLLLLVILTAFTAPTRAQSGFVANYDEAAVPSYTLPDILTTESGREVGTARQWEKTRRAEIIELFEENIYGRMPDGRVRMTCEALETSTEALGGKAVRKQTELTFSANGKERKALVLLYLPAGRKDVPTFVCLNFRGNQSITDDPAVIASQHSTYPRADRMSRWPVEKIVDAGYGLATVHYFDFFPDSKDGLAESVYPLFGVNSEKELADDQGGSITAWAWGYSRVMDYLEKEKAVDKERVIIMGHSRIGKTALWAGANDPRFAMVVANDSGCAGAALSRRKFGETIGRVNNHFPHWLCRNARKFSGAEESMPVDQHQLLALVAPRPLYISSATEDLWADPKGEYLAAYHAGEAYGLYGLEGLGSSQMPPADTPVGVRVGYHIRTGIHDVTDFDWQSWITFADRVLK